MKIIVNKVRRTKNEKEEKEVSKILGDGTQEKWESGNLGGDVEHMRVSEHQLSGKPTSLRLPEELKEQLTFLARKKGLSTHSYIRMILTEHAEQFGDHHHA